MSKVSPRFPLGALLFSLLSYTSLSAQNLSVPFRFEENRGQHASDAKYIGRAAGYLTEMLSDEVVIRAGGDAIHMSFVAAERGRIRPTGLMPAQTNFYNARTRQFYNHLRNYERLLYPDIYRGVDVVFRGSDRALEFDFVLKPHADHKSIVLNFTGQTALDIADDGSLVLATKSGEMRLLPPTVYQDFDDNRKIVRSRYVKTEPNRVRFDIGDYNPDHELVIDPRLVFARVSGPFGTRPTPPSKVVLGPTGDAYALWTSFGANDFSELIMTVVRFNGTQPVTFYSGYPHELFFLINDPGWDLAVDSLGDPAVLTTVTYQCSGCPRVWVPTLASIPRSSPQGDNEGAILKFGNNPFSTLLGGSGIDSGRAIAFDSLNNLYVAGHTNSTDFPTRNPFQSTLSGGQDGFITKINATGTQILYSTYIGGSGDDFINDLALDAAANVYLAGTTASTNFPVSNAIRSSNAGGSCTDSNGVAIPCTDMFVSKLNPAGTALVYSTYIGAPGADVETQMVISSDGTTFLTGLVPLAFTTTINTGFNSPTALIKLDRSGSRLTYSMRYPSVFGIAADDGGNLYTAGSSLTQAANFPFPVINSFRMDSVGQDMAVTKFDANGGLVFATLFGGTENVVFGCTACGPEFAEAIAVNAAGRMFVLGDSGSSDFPVTVGDSFGFSRVNDENAVILILDAASGTDTSPRHSRIEENYPQVKFTGAWLPNSSPNALHSMGRAVLAIDPGSKFSINFTGTDVKWFGCKDSFSGIAKVTLDGVSQGDVDTFSSTSQCRALLFSKSGLGAGAHNLTVEVAGRRNASSQSNWIWLDTIEVISAGDSIFDTPGGGTGGTPGGSTGTFTRVEQNSSQVAYSGQWYSINSAAFSGGSAVQAIDAGSRATFTFTGTAARWIGYKDQWSGIAKVFVDGVLNAQVDTYSVANQKQVILFTTPTLASGTHTLTIEVTGTRNPAASSNWIWIDAFESASSGSGTGGTGGNTTPTFTRVEQNGSTVTYSGNWYSINSGAFSGGSAVQAIDAGSRATFTFTGTSARWIGYKDQWSGIARVFIDGVFQAQVDAYSASDQRQVVLFATPALTSGTHTLTVEVTGTRNPASSSNWIVVDAFESSSGASGSGGGSGSTTFTRVEQTNSAVVYAGSWYTVSNAVFSAGSGIAAVDSGARATFTFTGTSARWIGYKDAWSGIARVYVDGVLQATVDSYSASDQKQVILFATSTLPPGTHTLTIEATGTRNPASASNWIWIDAFEFAQ